MWRRILPETRKCGKGKHACMLYYVGDAPYDETPYGTYPLWHDAVIADGKIYAGTGEWGEFETVIYRGQKLVAVDAINGDELWTIKGVYILSAIAEGYLFVSNAYDGYTYCFGRGPNRHRSLSVRVHYSKWI